MKARCGWMQKWKITWRLSASTNCWIGSMSFWCFYYWEFAFNDDTKAFGSFWSLSDQAESIRQTDCPSPRFISNDCLQLPYLEFTIGQIYIIWTSHALSNGPKSWLFSLIIISIHANQYAYMGGPADGRWDCEFLKYHGVLYLDTKLCTIPSLSSQAMAWCRIVDGTQLGLFLFAN